MICLNAVFGTEPMSLDERQFRKKTCGSSSSDYIVTCPGAGCPFIMNKRTCIRAGSGSRLRLTTMGTLTAVARDHCHSCPEILQIAQAEVIGALINICSPIMRNMSTCWMSLVERVIRLAAEKFPISSSKAWIAADPRRTRLSDPAQDGCVFPFLNCLSDRI